MKKIGLGTIYLLAFAVGLLFFSNPDIVNAEKSVCKGEAFLAAPQDAKSCGVECTKSNYSRSKFEKDGFLNGDKKCCCYGTKTPDRTPGKGSFGPDVANPFGDVYNVPELVGKILRDFMGILGVIALVIFIYGGFLWMISLGDETRVKKGRETMIWAGMGLIVIVGSYVVIQFILETVLKPPQPITSTASPPSAAGSISSSSAGGGTSGGTGSGTSAGTSGTSSGGGVGSGSTGGGSGAASGSSGSAGSGATGTGGTGSSAATGAATGTSAGTGGSSGTSSSGSSGTAGSSSGSATQNTGSETTTASAPFTDFKATFFGAGPNGSGAVDIVGTFYGISTTDELRDKYKLGLDKEKGIVVLGTDRSYTVVPLTSTEDASLKSISVRPHAVNSERVIVDTQNSDDTYRRITFEAGKAVEIQATSFIPGQSKPIIWSYNDDVINALQIKGGSSFLKTGQLPVVDKEGKDSSITFFENDGVTTKSVAMTTDGTGIVEILVTNSDFSVDRALLQGSRVVKIEKTCHTPPPESKETPC